MRFRWLAASEKRMNGNFPLYFSLGITWNEIQQCKPSSSQQPSSRRNLG